MNFRDKATIFNPPYDSPIEESFIWNMIKYIDAKVEILTQYEFQTSHGCFRLDFAIRLNDKLIGIECDGKEYHNISRDIWRDIIILNNSKTVDIFRLRGSDITYFINECILIISWYYPDLFDQRGINNLERLVDEEVLNENFYKEHPMSVIDLAYKKDGQIKKIKMFRISKKFPDYERITKLTEKEPTLTVDQLYEKYKK